MPWYLCGRLLKSRICLYPEILRVSKSIHCEASPLLSSKNRFEFPLIRETLCRDNIALFYRQIRPHQRNLINYVCMAFAKFFNTDSTVAVCEDDLKDLKRIRDSLTGLATIELHTRGFLVCTDPLLDTSIALEAIDLLDKRSWAIPSLKKIVVKTD